MKPMNKTLYKFYLDQRIQPTYADFCSEEELNNYTLIRKNVFYRLMFLHTFFRDKKILEFGPDTGENSLVFARWGAQLTLVEPNLEAHSYIRKYFSKFKLGSYLNDIAATDLLEFSPQQKFDVVDAEGFIYSIKPNSSWIKKVGKCLNYDGFLIISYMELYGGFIELLTKAIFHRVTSEKNYPADLETAKQLFLSKWNRIKHSRKIESWFMDVIENPFVRMKYFIDSVELLDDMFNEGFRLYSSWPNYKDLHNVNWIKAPLVNEDDLKTSMSFIEQSRLSYFLGRKCFLTNLACRELSYNLLQLIKITDGLIDTWTQEDCLAAIEHVESIEKYLNQLYQKSCNGDLSGVTKNLTMIKSIFRFMTYDDVGTLVEFCRNDDIFSSSWGVPAHYAIFQRTKLSK